MIVSNGKSVPREIRQHSALRKIIKRLPLNVQVVTICFIHNAMSDVESSALLQNFSEFKIVEIPII